MKKTTHRRVNRKERIGDLIQQSIADSLLRRTNDERFKQVTLTGVVVSRDLSYAKVYVSVLNEDEVKPIILALNRAAKLLRHYLAEDIKLRIVPELRFVYDDSIARGSEVSALISDAMKKIK